MFYSPILSFLRLIIFVFWTILCVTIQIFFIWTPKNTIFVIPRIYFKVLISLFGINITMKGVPNKINTVYVSNHTSYLDILILGANLDGLFVAKSEISTWPIINKLANLRKTIFVNRKKISKTRSQISVLDDSLNQGYNIILFPEGTSNDGTRVLPFKSSLFAITEFEKNSAYFIQPVSLAYSGLDGLPINRIFKPFFAWYGNMDLISHAWKFIGLGSCEIKVRFHKPIKFSEISSRKEVSKYCHESISRQLSIDLNSSNNEKYTYLHSYKYL